MTLIDQFKTYLSRESRSAGTNIGYLMDTRLFIKWFEKKCADTFAIENVTSEDIAEYRTYLQDEQGLKASTISRKLAALSVFRRWVIQTSQIGVDPAKLMKSPRWLNQAEQYALIAAIQQDDQQQVGRWQTQHRRDASIILFMLHTGLLLSEVVLLELNDVQAESILVRRANGNRERLIAINAEARQALQEWLAVRPQNSNPYLWVAMKPQRGEIVSGRAVQQALRRYAQIAGLQELHLDVLRHTFARNLVNDHVSVEEIAALLGVAHLNLLQFYITPDKHSQEDIACR